MPSLPPFLYLARKRELWVHTLYTCCTWYRQAQGNRDSWQSTVLGLCGSLMLSIEGTSRWVRGHGLTGTRPAPSPSTWSWVPLLICRLLFSLARPQCCVRHLFLMRSLVELHEKEYMKKMNRCGFFLLVIFIGRLGCCFSQWILFKSGPFLSWFWL